MKVLFAVSNDNVSNSIIKKYQQKYKEIITSKNVYYFNAIIKELQKDKSYDVVVIGEDLEPISNNNYDTIDKFIFEKLDNISDEAYKNTGEDIPIILICSDRRTKSDSLLVKLFGIGIYNALLGNDRNIDAVCNLINKPRSKKEAKSYYKIDSDDVNYKPESESEVSETEIQNILAHYKKIGNNEKKCVESFNSIAEQYSDTQLRIITKFLPLNVKAILEAKSERYQKLMTGGTVLSNGKYNQYQVPQKNVKSKDLDLLTKDLEKTKLTKPVIIPSTMNIETENNVVRNPDMQMQQNYNPQVQYRPQNQIVPQMNSNIGNSVENNESQVQSIADLSHINNNVGFENIPNSQANNGVEQNQINQVVEEKPKRRGRPRKVNNETQEEQSNQAQLQTEAPVKRGRGRPKKIVTEENKQEIVKDNTNQNETVNLFDLGNNSNDVENNNSTPNNVNTSSNDINLFGMANDENINSSPDIDINNFYNPYMTDNNSNINQVEEESIAENLNTTFDYNNAAPVQNNTQTMDNNQYESPYSTSPYNMNANSFGTEELVNTNRQNNVIRNSNFIAQNSKIISFVGTSKNGTSFIVNNLAELLSQKGIKTAILDLTKNKNSYYMFTDNDQRLMQIAGNSIKNLASSDANGVQVNKNLTVFTSLPGDDLELENIDAILQTLDNNFSAVLMDCDFETDINYFIKSTEIYLVQSMDALTIQPLTLFLSELKLKNVLDENKLRVIINKEMKLKILTDKMILGGMAKYNEPSMTLQRDLFNPNTIKYVTIPFEEQTYARYLEAIALCQVSLNGYSQRFLSSLENLANMVYPLIQGGMSNNYSGYSNYSPNYDKAKKGLFGGKSKKQTQTQFSSGVNGTLNKMRSNY